MRYSNIENCRFDSSEQVNLILNNLLHQLKFYDETSNENSKAAMECSLTFFKENNLMPILYWLIENPDSELFSLIASQSYLHGNGFLKLVLISAKNGQKLRLHYWQKGVTAEENIHCHRWSLSSLIILGELNSELYIEDSGPNSKNLDCYLYKKENDIASSHYLGDIKLKIANIESRVCPEFYNLGQGDMHRIIDSNKSSAATLMYQSSPTKAWNSLVTINKEVKPELNPPRLGKEELRESLLGLINELRGCQ